MPDVDPTRRIRPRSTASPRRSSVVPGVARVDAGHRLLPRRDRTARSFRSSPPNAFSQAVRAAPRARRARCLSVVPDVEPLSAQGEQLVKDIRATHAPFAFLVAGTSAKLVDTKHAVLARLPLALGLIALATFVLLFMMTGQPPRADQGAAAQHAEPHRDVRRDRVDLPGGSPLGPAAASPPTGSIDVFTPILMFCIAFGLSMDYEVFLLSRIKEEYDLERDNEHAVAVGLQKTGRIVTAAALLLTIVFVGIATSEVALVQDVRRRPHARGARRRVPHPGHARPRVHAPRRPRSTGGRRGGSVAGTCASGSGRTSRSRSSTGSSKATT